MLNVADSIAVDILVALKPFNLASDLVKFLAFCFYLGSKFCQSGAVVANGVRECQVVANLPKRHRYWLPAGQKLSKLPSEYFAENIYTTFQDDWVAFQCANMMNWKRLMWANDFPHSDSTWPWSQEMLKEHSQHLSDEQREAILCGNVAELYGLDLALLQ